MKQCRQIAFALLVDCDADLFVDEALVGVVLVTAVDDAERLGEVRVLELAEQESQKEIL